MTDTLSPAQRAEEIDASRQRLTDFIQGCTEAQWESSPVEGDPRPVGVITDHVAHAYEYLAGWITEILSGGSPHVDGELVDDLNAGHAASGAVPTQAQVTDHLKSSGDVLITLVGGLEQAQLELGDGRVDRFAMIAARHADSHREEIQENLG
ncbi:MAG TPA: DinB family protein [Streptosporangiaceae bacterium]|nr:DinB family protein [Streptosporangiaceae bacterium]